MITNGDVVLRLVLAAILGGIIGYQREATDRPAGFRTHILVCLGSALFMLISVDPFAGREFADPTRIASQVVVGIGFLGAGTIIRQGNIIIGLTTAASLWAVAGVGLAIGIGYFSGALVATGLILAVLAYFKWLEDRFIPRHQHKMLEVLVKDTQVSWTKLESLLGDKGIHVLQGHWVPRPGNQLLVKLAVDFPKNVSLAVAAEELSSISGVLRAEWSNVPSAGDVFER